MTESETNAGGVELENKEPAVIAEGEDQMEIIVEPVEKACHP